MTRDGPGDRRDRIRRRLVHRRTAATRLRGAHHGPQPAKEAGRRAVATRSRRRPADVVVADLTARRRLGRGHGRLRLRPARRLAARRGRPGDPNALIGPARDGTLRVLRAATRGRRQAGGDDLVDRRRDPAAADCGRRQRRDGLDRPRRPAASTPYRRSKILAERAAWDFMAGARRRRRVDHDPARSPCSARCCRRTTLGSVEVIAAPADRPPAGPAALRLHGRRRARPRRPAHPRDDRAGGGRRALHRRRRVPVAGRHRPTLRATPRRPRGQGADPRRTRRRGAAARARSCRHCGRSPRCSAAS